MEQVPPSQYASLVPLDFGDSRKELSLVYASTSWDELAILLSNPIEFYADCQHGWKQESEGEEVDAPWILFNPVSVFLKWAGDSIEHTLLRLGKKPSEELQRHSLGHKSYQELTKAERTKILDAAFAEGVFISEFALETHTLSIRYHAPAGSKRAAALFTGEYTSSTLVKQTQNDGFKQSVATIHFDIGQDPVQRALFVVDYLENCITVLNRATHAPGQAFRSGDADLVPKGGTIHIKPPEVSEVPQFKELPLTPFVIIETALSIPPSETVKNDDDDPTCQICVEVNGVLTQPTTGGTTYEPDMTIVKCYIPPIPPTPPPAKVS
jgi:hypothetical protein